MSTELTSSNVRYELSQEPHSAKKKIGPCLESCGLRHLASSTQRHITSSPISNHGQSSDGAAKHSPYIKDQLQEFIAGKCDQIILSTYLLGIL